MADLQFPWIVGKVVLTMKRGEKCTALVKRAYVKEKNPEFWAHIVEQSGDKDLPETGFIYLTIELHNFVKVEDRY